MDTMQARYKIHQVTFFIVLWGVAHIGHFLRKGNEFDPFVWLMFLCSVLLICKPRSIKRLFSLSLIQLIYLFKEMPFTDNHLYIMGFINAGLLYGAIKSLFYRKPDNVEHAVRNIPYICLVLIIAYTAAAFSKLNSGFFLIEKSCAVSMFYDSFSFITKKAFLPDILEAGLPFFITATELSIPLLLLLRQTRHAGIILLIFFHIAISLSPTATALDFTIMLFALSTLFMDKNLYSTFLNTIQKTRLFLLQLIRKQTYLMPIAIFLLLVFVKVLSRVDFISYHLYWFILAPSALIFGGIVIKSIFSSGLFRKAEQEISMMSFFNFYNSVLLFILLINIASPYLGLKTTGTFTMYSNLQTFNGDSNHYLVKRLPLFMPMDDMVRIIDSDHHALLKYAGNNEWLTYHEFRRILSASPNTSVTYSRNGKLYSYDKVAQNPELVKTDPVWNKLAGHRLYDPNSASCRW